MKETFKTSNVNTVTKDCFHENVLGDRIVIAGFPAFVFKEIDHDYDGEEIEGWNVSHLETGMRMSGDLSKQEAIRKAEHNCTKYPEAIEKGRQICIEHGIVLPVNI